MESLWDCLHDCVHDNEGGISVWEGAMHTHQTQVLYSMKYWKCVLHGESRRGVAGQ